MREDKKLYYCAVIDDENYGFQTFEDLETIIAKERGE